MSRKTGYTIRYFSHYHTSETMVTDKRATIVQSFAYMPYGELLVEGSCVDLAYRFSAKETDRETGLSYFGARYYDPTAAMWLGADPLWEAYVGMNPYNYCAGNPVGLVDEDGMHPEGVIEPQNRNSDIFKIKPAASHLLSLVSGVDEQCISLTYILQRAPGHYIPFYSSNKGGGAITIGNSSYVGTIILTQNYFENDKKSYNNHGYGQNAKEWLFLLSHEVGHLPQIDEYNCMWVYMASFLVDYVKYRSHDNVPREKIADIGYMQLKSFSNYIDKKFGKNALWKLFEDESLPQSYIKEKIDLWWNNYLKSKDYKSFQNEKSKIIQEANQ